MTNYPIEKYKFYSTPGGKVIAVSSYGGASVRGVAKCDSVDTFDLEKGKKLAAARCNLKVSEKRLNRATKRLAEAHEALYRAQLMVDKMTDYFKDSREAYLAADAGVQKLLKQF